jgi:hypothetical protein
MNDIKAFLWRGAAAGAIAGLVTALYQWIIVERQIDKAISIEASRAADGGQAEMFTRGQQVAGGMLAAVLFGTVIGVVLGFACAALWTRLPGATAFSRSIRLALVAYVACGMIPNLKYPANPPGVGDPDTIGQRSASYLLLMAASLILAYLAWELWQRLTVRGRHGAERFTLVAAAYLAAITLAWVLFPPSPDAVELPANLVWHFRVESLGAIAVLWVGCGTAFGFLADREEARASSGVRA